MTEYVWRIECTEPEIESLARGELPPTVQDAAIALLRMANSTPAQAVDHSRDTAIPLSKRCRACGRRWAQPNTGGRCTACYRREAQSA